MSGDDGTWRLPTPKAGCKMEKCLMDKKDVLIPEAMIEQVKCTFVYILLIIRGDKGNVEESWKLI